MTSIHAPIDAILPQNPFVEGSSLILPAETVKDFLKVDFESECLPFAFLYPHNYFIKDEWAIQNRVIFYKNSLNKAHHQMNYLL